MKPLLVLLVCFLPVISILSQDNQITQDPAAGKVLERVAQKFGTMKSLQCNFELLIEDRKENKKNTSAGSLLMKQKKYKLISEGNTVYYNGTTMWTYASAIHEVTITEPKNQTSDFMSNPADFFDTYKRDFKYRYVREITLLGARCHEIDLFPKNLNQTYARIKIYINTQTDFPVMISSVGKDGVDYTVSLKNPVTDQDLDDSVFTFNPSLHKKVEVVDMRGTE